MAAFKKESIEHPNYGKAVGMKAPEWWSNVSSHEFSLLMSFTCVAEILSRFYPLIR